MMDMDVTQELLTLYKANLEVFVKFFEFLITIAKNKYEKYKSGLVDAKTFFRQNEPTMTLNMEVPEKLLKDEKHIKEFDKILKKCGVAAIITEKDGKHYFVCAENKIEAFSYAASQYLKWAAKEEQKENGLSHEVGGETERELESIQERNEKIEELYKIETKDGVVVDVPVNMFSKKQDMDILNAVREVNNQEAHFSKKNLKAIMDKTNEEFTGNDIIIGKNNKTLNEIIEECDIKKGMNSEERRHVIADKIKEEIGGDSDKNFISLRNNKGIFFNDNNHNVVMVDLISMKLRVTKDQFFNGKPLYAYMQKIIIAAKAHIKDRDEILDTMTAGKDFSKEKLEFMKQMSEKAITIDKTTMTIKPNNEIENNFFAVWNYMTSKEGNERDVTDKDRAMFNSVQNSTFDKRMATEEHIDAEACWIIADAIENELNQEVIDHLFSQELDNDDRRVIVDISKEAKEKNITYSIEELNEYCEEAKEKIVDIRYYNATDRFAEKQKTTFEGVQTDLAQQHIEEMQVSDKVVAAIEKAEIKDASFKDASGEQWYEAYKDRKTGNKVFVNEDKSKAIYEGIIKEDVPKERIDELKKSNKKAFDTKSGTYYKDGKDKFVTENGKKVLHKSINIVKTKEQQHSQEQTQQKDKLSKSDKTQKSTER